MGIFLNFNNVKICKCLFICSNRKISLNCAPELNKYMYREAKMMNKLMETSKKKRKTYFEANTVPVGGKLNWEGGIKSSKENSRRIAVLNALFMKHISDLLVTGNIAEDVLGKGLEISRVAMTPTFNQLNVFWGTHNEKSIVDLEKVLPQVGFSLRHELSQLQVIGIVPRIVFMKDKHFGSAQKVDYLLSIADFGEDHEPVPLGSEFKNAPLVENVISSNAVKDNSDKAEDRDEKTENEEELQLGEQMPVMRHDIFNLDHERIMNKVIKLLQKSRALHRFQPNLEIDCKGSETKCSQVPVQYMTKQERREALARFILERKKLHHKRRQNKYNSELNVYNVEESEDDDEDSYDNEDFVSQEYTEEYLDDPKFDKKVN
uniref:Ribosome-binding factor A, mitochondrial n=1 Tax=Cuerna arida TaxID=1464854 RepID=A0A1B6FTU9_9HEMI